MQHVSVEFGQFKIVLEGFDTYKEGVKMAVVLIRQLANLDIRQDIVAKLALHATRLADEDTAHDTALGEAATGKTPMPLAQISLTKAELLPDTPNNTTQTETSFTAVPRTAHVTEFRSIRSQFTKSVGPLNRTDEAASREWRLEVARLEASIDDAIQSLGLVANTNGSGIAQETPAFPPAPFALAVADVLVPDDPEAQDDPLQELAEDNPVLATAAPQYLEQADADAKTLTPDQAPATDDNNGPLDPPFIDKADTQHTAQAISEIAAAISAGETAPEQPADIQIPPVTSTKDFSANDTAGDTGQKTEFSTKPYVEIIGAPAIERSLAFNREAIAKAAGEHSADSSGATVRNPDYQAIEDEAIERLIITTNALLNDEEHTRQSQSLERLKAAVVATEAERNIRVKTTRGTATLDFDGAKSHQKFAKASILPPEPTPEMRTKRIVAYRKMIAARKISF